MPKQSQSISFGSKWNQEICSHSPLNCPATEAKSIAHGNAVHKTLQTGSQRTHISIGHGSSTTQVLSKRVSLKKEKGAEDRRQNLYPTFWSNLVSAGSWKQISFCLGIRDLIRTERPSYPTKFSSPGNYRAAAAWTVWGASETEKSKGQVLLSRPHRQVHKWLRQGPVR